MHIHTHMYISIYIYIYTHIHIYIYTYRHTCTYITLHSSGCLAGIAKRNQWEIPYTGAIQTRWAIGGNRENEINSDVSFKIQVTSVPGGIAKRNQWEMQ